MPSPPPNTSPAAWRDWQSRTANTVLMYCFMIAFVVSAIISGQAVARSRESSWWHGKIDPVIATRLSYANAGLDVASLGYIATFLTLHHRGEGMIVWAQILGLGTLVAWNIAFGVALQASEERHEWLWCSGVINYLKAAMASVLIVFVVTHTLVAHGTPGLKDRFAPLADEVTAQRRCRVVDAGKAAKRDRDARIAIVVLVSVLDMFALAAAIWSCVETLGLWETYARGLNVAHIISIPTLWIFFIWLGVYLYVRSNETDSTFVTARSDVFWFSVWGALLLILGGVTLGLVITEISYMGGMTGILCLSAGDTKSQGREAITDDQQTLVLAFFEGIYTHLHGGEGKWLRRFATAKPETQASSHDVEFGEQKSARPSTVVDKDERGQHHVPTLGYNATN